MKTYLVGGAVRDALLGLPVVERDWVVVGTDREHMLAQGFLPADASFPVFRHPRTDEEYALARREIKRGEGYRGFDVDAGPDVTLEDDLRRRDLTVNAIAQTEDGELIDPYGGRDDLDNGLLRHVSESFVEDPVRILRIARFAAKLGRHGFRVAHGTHRLMRQMVERGDMAHLTAERTWRELLRAMACEQPWRFLEVLNGCGALAEIVPVLARAMGTTSTHADMPDSAPIAALKRIAPSNSDVRVRLVAALWSCVDDAIQARELSRALRADREFARLLGRIGESHALCAKALDGELDAIIELAIRWQSINDRAGVADLVAIFAAQSDDFRYRQRIEQALDAAAGVSVTKLRERGFEGAALGETLAVERREAIRSALMNMDLIN